MLLGNPARKVEWDQIFQCFTISKSPLPLFQIKNLIIKLTESHIKKVRLPKTSGT